VELRGSIRPAIPSLIQLLKDQYLEVRIAAAFALAKLTEHGESPQSLDEMSLMRI
jgi:HEAT repeat protein